MHNIYTVPGVDGRFIFSIRTTTASCADTGREFWEAEVIGLPNFAVVQQAQGKLQDLAITQQDNGRCILDEDKLLYGTNRELIEQYLINYCIAYVRHLRLGLPVQTFL